MRDQREVFPGLDSGPNGSEGHYFYTLEKRPSGPSLYTTYVLLETRLREFNRNAVDVGGVGDLDFGCVTKMDDISILLIRSDNQ